MILSCPDVHLLCINNILSLTVCLNLLICELAFYTRDAMRKSSLCCRAVSVRLSVRPSHAGIVSKRLNRSLFFSTIW